MSTKRSSLVCSLSLAMLLTGAGLSQVQAQNNTKRASRPLQSLFFGSVPQKQGTADPQDQKWSMPRPFQGLRTTLQENPGAGWQKSEQMQGNHHVHHSGTNHTAKYPSQQNYKRSSNSQLYASKNPAGNGLIPSMEELMKPSMSRTSAMEIMSRIPMSKMNAAEQKVVRTILSDYTIYRRLPMAGGICNPEVFDYFLTHPDTVVGLWEVLGSTELSMVRTSSHSFDIQDDSGTTGSVYILYQDDELTVAFCKGYYRGPIANRKIEGDMLLILQTRYTESENRQPITVCRLDSFVRIKNMGAELFTRTFAPALGKIADTNFEQTISFICSLSDLAEESPASFAGMINKLTRTTQQSRTNLYTTVERTFKQAEQRAEGKLPLYQLVSKKNQPVAGTARLLSRVNGENTSSLPIQKTSIAPPVPQPEKEDPFVNVPELKIDRNPSDSQSEVRKSSSIQTLKNLKSGKKVNTSLSVDSAKAKEQTVPDKPISSHLPAIPESEKKQEVKTKDLSASPQKREIAPLTSQKKNLSDKPDLSTTEPAKEDKLPLKTKSDPVKEISADPQKEKVKKDKTNSPQPLIMEEKGSSPIVKEKKETKPVQKNKAEKESHIEVIPENTWKTVKK